MAQHADESRQNVEHREGADQPDLERPAVRDVHSASRPSV